MSAFLDACGDQSLGIQVSKRLQLTLQRMGHAWIPADNQDRKARKDLLKSDICSAISFTLISSTTGCSG